MILLITETNRNKEEIMIRNGSELVIGALYGENQLGLLKTYLSTLPWRDRTEAISIFIGSLLDDANKCMVDKVLNSLSLLDEHGRTEAIEYLVTSLIKHGHATELKRCLDTVGITLFAEMKVSIVSTTRELGNAHEFEVACRLANLIPAHRDYQELLAMAIHNGHLGSADYACERIFALFKKVRKLSIQELRRIMEIQVCERRYNDANITAQRINERKRPTRPKDAKKK